MQNVQNKRSFIIVRGEKQNINWPIHFEMSAEEIMIQGEHFLC